MREPPKWVDDLAVLSSAMIHAVLDKSYHQHQASARRYAGDKLRDIPRCAASHPADARRRSSVAGFMWPKRVLI
jgi:hypothetical protein